MLVRLSSLHSQATLCLTSAPVLTLLPGRGSMEAMDMDGLAMEARLMAVHHGLPARGSLNRGQRVPSYVPQGSLNGHKQHRQVDLYRGSPSQLNGRAGPNCGLHLWQGLNEETLHLHSSFGRVGSLPT